MNYVVSLEVTDLGSNSCVRAELSYFESRARAEIFFDALVSRGLTPHLAQLVPEWEN